MEDHKEEKTPIYWEDIGKFFRFLLVVAMIFSILSFAMWVGYTLGNQDGEKTGALGQAAWDKEYIDSAVAVCTTSTTTAQYLKNHD